MEQRVPTIFEVAEQAARRQKKATPQAGQRKLKRARKASGRTSRRPPATPKRKRASRRKS
jgi:hypothetical protein